MNLPPNEIVITCDLVEFLEHRRGMVFGDDLRRRVIDLGAQFVEEFRQILVGHASVTAFDASELSAGLRESAGPDEFRMSLDRTVIAWAVAHFAITTIFDAGGNREWVVGTGPAALGEIAARVAGKPVTLVDVGAQSGATVLRACGGLHAAGIHVAKVLLGLGNRRAVERVKATVDVECLHIYEAMRWYELRDLLGIDGRLLRDRMGGASRSLDSNMLMNTLPFDVGPRELLAEHCREWSKRLAHTLSSDRGGER